MIVKIGEINGRRSVSVIELGEDTAGDLFMEWSCQSWRTDGEIKGGVLGGWTPRQIVGLYITGDAVPDFDVQWNFTDEGDRLALKMLRQK